MCLVFVNLSFVFVFCRYANRSHGIVERTDFRLGRQFKRAHGSVGRRRQRSSEDTAVSQRLDRRLGPGRHMHQLVNIGCLVHGHQQVTYYCLLMYLSVRKSGIGVRVLIVFTGDRC